MTAPPAVEERGLVDDVDAALHRRDRLGLRCREIPRRAQIRLQDLVDRATLCPKSLEERALVGVTAFLEEHDLGIQALRRTLPATLDAAELQRRQVAALQESDQIRGADDERPGVLHD